MQVLLRHLRAKDLKFNDALKCAEMIDRFRKKKKEPETSDPEAPAKPPETPNDVLSGLM